jgi:adenylate kinase
MLAAEFGIPHISPGEMFRAAVRSGTRLGLEAQKYMTRGALVPDDITVGIIRERLSQPDCRPGLILDGFPRNLAQAKVLDEIVADLGLPFDGAVGIEVPDDELIRRSVGRRVCSRCGQTYHLEFNPPATGSCDRCGSELVWREDDREETVRKRLEVYRQHTAPLIELYRRRDQYRAVDGNRPIPEVFAALAGVLREFAR